MGEAKLSWNKRMEIERVKRSLTQSQAAELIGVKIGTYGRWERGENKPLPIYQKLIANAFKIADEIEFFTD